MKFSVSDIYEMLSKDSKSDTETPELSEKFHEFYENTLKPISPYDETSYNDLLSVVYGFNKQGFISGFNTAVNLLFQKEVQK